MSVSGPFLTGPERRVLVDRMVTDLRDAVAQQAFSDVHRNMDTSFKNPTPYYEVQVVNQVLSGDRVIHDRDIVYGRWLEGAGSRNYPVTSFRGYRSFGRAMESAEAAIPRIAARVLAGHINRLNGG